MGLKTTTNKSFIDEVERMYIRGLKCISVAIIVSFILTIEIDHMSYFIKFSLKNGLLRKIGSFINFVCKFSASTALLKAPGFFFSLAPGRLKTNATILAARAHIGVDSRYKRVF